MDLLIRAGDLPGLKRLYERNKSMNLDSIFQSAYSCGQLHIMKWVYENNKKLARSLTNDPHALVSSCYGDNLEIAKWFYELYDKPEKTSKLFMQECLRYACCENRIEIVKWLLDICAEKDIKPYQENYQDLLMCVSCGRGFLNMAKLLVERGFDIRGGGPEADAPFKYACRGKQTEVIKWMEEICSEYHHKFCEGETVPIVDIKQEDVVN